MDKIEFQENFIWSKLSCNRNILELTTYDGIAYWWNIDYLFYNFVRLTTESKGAKFSITKRNMMTAMIFGGRMGLYFFFVLELCLFLYGILINFTEELQRKIYPTKKNLIFL